MMRWMVLATVATMTVSCIAKKQNEVSSGIFGSNESRPKINVMAPLVIGNPAELTSVESVAAWKNFRDELDEIKDLGAYAVTTDIWWGLVEPKDNAFDWAYYDKLADAVYQSGLKWIPIISTHQCGGNVGDQCQIPIPPWLWQKYTTEAEPEINLQYLSEEGHASKEVLSAWATARVIEEYRDLFSAFQSQFGKYADIIPEINISLGPAGELRYPSYNAHDKNSGYPARGSFQSFSPPAIASWLAYVAKHGTKEGAIGLPPLSVQKWIDSGSYKEDTGKLYIEWYQWSLLEHGNLLMSNAIATFNQKEGPFYGISLGAKIPGLHWRIGTRNRDGSIVFGDRLSEIAAGLINHDEQAWNLNLMGRGYSEIVSLFNILGRKARPGGVVLHFTALEMEDGQGKPEVQSLASTLVQWVGQEALRQKVPLKGENALAWNLGDKDAWKRMKSHIKTSNNPLGLYQGLTVLRMTDILISDVAKAAFRELAQGE